MNNKILNIKDISLNIKEMSLLKNKKYNLNKIIKCASGSLLLILIPNESLALSESEILTKLKVGGLKATEVISIGLIKVILIISVIRLLNEYINGANERKFFDILKESLAIILVVTLIPKIPTIINLFLN